MLSVKQGGIKYHFLSLWYDSTWDWNPIFQTIGEHYLLGQWPVLILIISRRIYAFKLVDLFNNVNF